MAHTCSHQLKYNSIPKGEVGTRTRIGYSFIVRETGARTGQEDEGGVGGSHTSVVFVQATRHIEKEEEFLLPCKKVMRSNVQISVSF